MAETRQFVMLIFWLIHFTFFTHAAVSCPGDYVPSEESSSCVNVFVNLNLPYNTWYEARDECRLEGGDLVKIVNQAMNDFINNMALSNANIYSYLWTWIGLNDPNSDDTWVWLDEEDQAAWTNWKNGQPDSRDQDCASLDTSSYGEWRDLDCNNYSYSEGYICEIPALTTTTATTTTTITTSTAVTTVTIPKILTSLATTSTTTSSPVVTRETSSEGLSGAVIAGIVIGVLVVAALVPAAFFTIRYFRNRQRTGHSHTDHSVAYTHGLDDRQAIVTVG